ncbi:MAG: protein translocase subunit yajC [Nocardioides sp.]|nr:protein translocase subunit yajC [Nocardioides sp.]
MPELVSLLPLVGIALLFWLLIIRPNSRRQKELSRMQASLEVGDEVMLTSGIFGTLRELDGEHVRVEIAEGVIIKVARGAVGTIAESGLDAHEPEES